MGQNVPVNYTMDIDEIRPEGYEPRIHLTYYFELINKNIPKICEEGDDEDILPKNFQSIYGMMSESIEMGD